MISQVAQTLYDQIPKQVLRDVGARDLVAFDEGIQFRVKNNGKFNKIVIMYNETEDLYNMEFWDVHVEDYDFDIRCEKVDELQGIYFDQLGDIITGRVTA